MLHFLEKNGVPKEDLAPFTATKPSPGLYAFMVGKESLYLMFWPNETAFANVSMKDPACNFIRYLFELSNTVIGFVNEPEVYMCLILTDIVVFTSKLF
jgi:hypothetical protein